jgi:hypothetical protein
MYAEVTSAFVESGERLIRSATRFMSRPTWAE